MPDVRVLATIFGYSLTIAFSGALMPGPMLVVTAVHAHRRGWTAGPLVVLGHGILELVLVVIAGLGLGEYLQDPSATFVGVIGLAGGAALAVMGIAMLIGSRKVELKDPAAEGSAPAEVRGGPRDIYRTALAAGIWSSLVNPYWSVWWLGIGLMLVAWSGKAGAVGLAVFFIGHILADLIWYTFASISFSKGKAFLSQTLFRALVLGGGGLLLYFAGTFAYYGGRALLTGEYQVPGVEAIRGLPQPDDNP